MRENLRRFRKYKNLTQEGIAEIIGVTRHNYSAVENGSRDGRYKLFWLPLQKKFNIPDDEMWTLMKRHEDEE